MKALLISLFLLQSLFAHEYMVNERVLENLQVIGLEKKTLKVLKGLEAKPFANKEAFLQALRSHFSLASLNKKVSRKLSVQDVILSHADTRIDKAIAEYELVNPLKYALGEKAYEEAMRSGEYTYSGNLKCRSCHRDFFMGRKKDAHVYTFRKHLAKNFANEPSCLGCHSTGFGVPSGFVDTKSTAKLKDISCEGCHGPGSKHNARGAKGGFLAGADNPHILKRMCKACHTKRWDHSYTNFEKAYDQYKEAEARAKGKGLY